MNLLYIILKHMVWRFRIYNYFREIFKLIDSTFGRGALIIHTFGRGSLIGCGDSRLVVAA